MTRTESRPLLSGSMESTRAEPAAFRFLTAVSAAPPTHGRLSPVTPSIFMMPGLLESMAWWTVQEQARFDLGSRGPSAAGRGWRRASGGAPCPDTDRDGLAAVALP